MSVKLVKMTRTMMHDFFKAFKYDPEAMEESENKLYIYNKEKIDQLYNKHSNQGKLHFAIIHEEQIVGDIYLKHIDPVAQTCELGIHMVNDNYKGKGYGTHAQRILLAYAFEKLNMKTVYADALITNERSIHVLKKVGFVEIGRNCSIARFECQKCSQNGLVSLDTCIIS